MTRIVTPRRGARWALFEDDRLQQPHQLVCLGTLQTEQQILGLEASGKLKPRLWALRLKQLRLRAAGASTEALDRVWDRICRVLRLASSRPAA